MRFWVIVLLVLVSTGTALFLFEFVGPGLFGPDGINLVKNGSFEDPKDPPPGEIDVGDCKLLCDGSTTIANWVVSGHGALNPQPCPTGSGKANDAVCWIFKPAEVNPVAAQDGIRFVDLTGFNLRAPNQYGAVSQAVPTERGKRYELSFWIGSSSKFTRGAETLQVVVQIDGVTSGAFLTPLPQNVSQWDQVRYRQTAASGSRRTARRRP